MTKKQVIQERENYWRKKILEWQASGEQANIFCKSRKITVSSFYLWRNRLFPALKKSQNIKPTKSPLFVPIQFTQKIEETTLHLPNGCWVILKPDFDMASISRLICALGGNDVDASRR